MKWDNMSLRDRIAARLYVSFIYTSTEPITFIATAWARADKIARRKCRAAADTVLAEREQQGDKT